MAGIYTSFIVVGSSILFLRHGFVVVVFVYFCPHNSQTHLPLPLLALRRVDGRPFAFVRRILLGMCGIQSLSYRIVAIYSAFYLSLGLSIHCFDSHDTSKNGCVRRACPPSFFGTHIDLAENK